MTTPLTCEREKGGGAVLVSQLRVGSEADTETDVRTRVR